MKLKPSVLKGVESILGSKKIESFVSDDDSLIIEDNSGRLKISDKKISNNDKVSSEQLITGIVTAIKGHIDDKDKLVIEDLIFPRDYNYKLPSKISNSFNNSSNENSIYKLLSSNSPVIAFISGLQFGKTDKSGKLNLSRTLLIDLLQGRFPIHENIHDLIMRVNRLVIIGNSICSPEDIDYVEKGAYIKQELNTRVYKQLLQTYEELDDYIETLSQSVQVDIMPGSSDATSIFFPQAPLNTVVLPNSSRNSSVVLANNPHKFSINGLNILGTSGQNVDNIRRYTSISQESVDIMEKTIEWGHVCPSAPDTLRTNPVDNVDPLIIREIPNVYFTGNQKSFAKKMIDYEEGVVRLISVPDFSQTCSLVLMDMDTLQVMEYCIELPK